MIKLPEGIGFVAEDFFPLQNQCGPISRGDTDGLYEDAARAANAKLPALFEAWVKREGVPQFGEEHDDEPGVIAWRPYKSPCDTHQAYLVLCEEIKK